MTDPIHPTAQLTSYPSASPSARPPMSPSIGPSPGPTSPEQAEQARQTHTQQDPKLRPGERIEITHVPERNVISPRETRPFVSKVWWAFSRLCTLLIPDIYLSSSFGILGLCGKKKKPLKNEEERQAWREKWTLCFIMFLFSLVFIGLGGVIPLILCEDVDNLSFGEESISYDVTRDQLACEAMNILMYIVMLIVSLVLIIQCICSLAYVIRCKRTITREETRSKVIIMVPCYNEGEKELKKTINSVIDTSYPDTNKVLLVVADGNITGRDEPKSTPEFLAEILGYDINEEFGVFDCTSIGERTENRARLYCGTYDDGNGKPLKYIVLVKCGTLAEAEGGNTRAGNRGKRDSQLLLTGLFNRFHHGRELNDLDLGMKNALGRLGLPLEEIKYLMAIDADTKIDRESITHMIYSMNADEKVLALCGETRIENKTASWITMIQVFEYYTNHHMKKAFESFFGCVTCLPGCFTMYRLFSDDNRPLLASDHVFQRYAKNEIKTLHDKNLFHLGEDRMLTTLLLRNFPGYKLSFVPEAICYTIVPHTFAILLSQRRRWVNSTFHNLLELLSTKTTTCCCISMQVLVVFDLISTLILPASLIYLLVNIYITTIVDQSISTFMLIVIGISIGVQVLVFVLRARMDYWWWFFVFMVLGIPIFYFILPLYSFWHMDDFSWGATRQVSDDAAPGVSNANNQGNVGVSNGAASMNGNSPTKVVQTNRVVQSSSGHSNPMGVERPIHRHDVGPPVSRNATIPSGITSKPPNWTPNGLDEDELDKELQFLEDDVVAAV